AGTETMIVFAAKSVNNFGTAFCCQISVATLINKISIIGAGKMPGKQFFFVSVGLPVYKMQFHAEELAEFQNRIFDNFTAHKAVCAEAKLSPGTGGCQ